MPLPREIYRTEDLEPFEFKPNGTGGYDLYVFGYANFGWETPEDSPNYTGPYLFNTIGNWRYSYLAPAILHMIALIDCERVSGARPENKWSYQTDRYLGYMTGFNSAQYAVGMRDSWFPFLGIICQSLVSVRKGVLQKKGRHWYDDQGSAHGWLAGFAIGAVSELLYKDHQISWGRMLLAILPGVIPAMIQAVKLETIEAMGFGTDGFFDTSSTTNRSDVYYTFNDPRSPGSPYYFASDHLQGIVRGLKIEGFDNIVQEFATNPQPDSLKLLLTNDKTLLEDMLFLILQTLQKLQIDGLILERHKDVAINVCKGILEPAFIPFTIEDRVPDDYRENYDRLNKLLRHIGSIKEWSLLFKKSIKHRGHTFPYDKLGNTEKALRAWPQLFNVGGAHMFPRDLRQVFGIRIDICLDMELISKDEAKILRTFLVGDWDTNQFNINFYNKHKVHYIDEFPN